LTRSLGNASTRRNVMKLALAGGLGVLGLAGASETFAKCDGVGKTCRKNQNCCQGLRCNVPAGAVAGTCEYKGGCGKQRQYCKINRDCCGGLRCVDNGCAR
jgi:hypothetical protein